MLGLTLRDEFRGAKLQGTTIDFSNDSKTGALDRSAEEFLRITYPSIDLIKTLDAIAPSANRAVVLVGDRGQGKSHLMAAACHVLNNPAAGRTWLDYWASKLGDSSLSTLGIRKDQCVIAEALHNQRFKYLWDILFSLHPEGKFGEGLWAAQGDKKTDIPGRAVMLEMFKKAPVMLVLDEFQTWFDGLSNDAKPIQNWAFNFIQILSEIAEQHPELLTLIVSVRDSSSNAAQQLMRVNPVRVDFRGEQAQRDRRRLLLHRAFENRMNVPASAIEGLISPHIKEYMRLASKPASEEEKYRSQYVETWPYSLELLQLLDDEVVFSTQAQGTRDLIRILVELFKARGDAVPIITAADFNVGDDGGGSVGSLLGSVANRLHQTLQEKALRNLTAVRETVDKPDETVPHLREIISALWVRSLTVEAAKAGADPERLQIDITRDKPIDDNAFQVELATIEANSFNIHKIGTRLLFRAEDNPRTRLLTYARNDKQFEDERDLKQLAKELRHIVGGDETTSPLFRTVVLPKDWASNPWAELEDADKPAGWSSKIPMLVLPECPENIGATLGTWLKAHMGTQRNVARFLLPKKGAANIYFDADLLVAARAVCLAQEWAASDAKYRNLVGDFRDELKKKLADRFDRFAVLQTWNYGEPAKCAFSVMPHGSKGDKIPAAVHTAIRRDLLEPEEFEKIAVAFAQDSRSVADFLNELREPRTGGAPCVPWVGESEAKDLLLRVCASGKIAIDNLGLGRLQANPGEDSETVWNRIKGKLGTGKQLEGTTIMLPGSAPSSGGSGDGIPGGPGPGGGAPGGGSGPGGDSPLPPGQGPAAPDDESGIPPDIFGGGTSGSGVLVHYEATPTSGLNLLGKLDGWGIAATTPVRHVALKVDTLTGAQLQKLLKALPDGIHYGIEVDKDSGDAPK
jgi:hypothetical protein